MTRGRKAMAERTIQVAFRLPSELIETLDAYVSDLRKRTPGLSVTRADAVRILLARGLDQEGHRVIRNDSGDQSK